jgi:UDP-N-acetylglucosamine 2-epimerase
LLCPSDTAIANLRREGIAQNVHLVGDVMLDVMHWAKQRAQLVPSPVLKDMDLRKRNYLVVTAHRSENIDDPGRFASILHALNSIEQLMIFPVHPRSRKVLAALGFQPKPHLKLIDPLGYVDMIALVSSARLVLTDSGGLQKEAYWLAVPCLTMRNETEWVETVATGWNLLVGTESEVIVNAVKTFSPPTLHPALYGDGAAAEKCVNLLRTGEDLSVGPAKGMGYAASN